LEDLSVDGRILRNSVSLHGLAWLVSVYRSVTGLLLVWC
jgi:hypothetical protein